MDPRSPPEAEIQSLINLIRKPSKPQLQNICTLNGLPKTGNKADLQLRITQRKFPSHLPLFVLFLQIDPPPSHVFDSCF